MTGGDHNPPEVALSDIPDDLAPFKRDRAFSFEFFTFAGDDLLPNPPAAPSPAPPLPEPRMSAHETVGSRPRGDSLIFDPVSFQDGGIHEKNAITKVNAAKKVETPVPPQGGWEVTRRPKKKHVRWKLPGIPQQASQSSTGRRLHATTHPSW